MDSLDLINVNKDVQSYTKPIKKTKFIICLNYFDLKLILLFTILISNLYLIYSFKSISNYKASSKSFFSKISKTDKISDEEPIIKESFIMQKEFCDNPNKYLNQEYENMITLTNFSFLNVDYQMYVYKSGDNYMSKGILRSKKYDAHEIPNICNVLELYAKKKIYKIKKISIY